MSNIKRIHPGIYIKESLDAMEMTAREFSFRTGISERTLSSIINGNGDITFDVAYKLSQYFDNSMNYWINLQTQYNVFLLEKNKKQEIEQEWKMIQGIKKYLIDMKYISSLDNKMEIVYECRELAGVNSLLLLNKKDSFVCFKEQNVNKNSNYFYQNFWIALALKEARKKNGFAFNKKLLLNSIDEIRSLTLEEPSYFYPRLQEIFSSCGVSFVLLPDLKESNICGSTKWFSKDNVMLAISNKGEYADIFWLTLFHEISHVLLEHRRETLVNISGNEDTEADKMAFEMLIPMTEWNKFISNKTFTKESINAFANKIGIHPSIVLNRLQKEEEVPCGFLDIFFNVEYHIPINYK